MLSDSIWIIGSSRSGKTTRLVERFCRWVESESHIQEKFSTHRQIHSATESVPQRLHTQSSPPGVLVLAANDDNRRELADSIVAATSGKYPIRAKTPLGFFQDEVILFWPLLIGLLNLKAQFPVRLRPETEQELATLLWHQQLDEEILRPIGVSESRLVRRLLDILQLAAYSGTPLEEIASVLAAMEAEGYEEAEEAEGETLIQNSKSKITPLPPLGETPLSEWLQNPKSKIPTPYCYSGVTGVGNEDF